MKTRFDTAKWQADSDGTWLCFRMPHNQAISVLESMEPDKPYDLEVKRHRERRSLDANAYCWVLLGKLAEHYGLPPAEIYRQQIQNIGSNYEVLPVRKDAADRWVEIWESKGIGFIAQNIGPSKLEGYINFRCYYGSHVYDTHQMSQLIDAIVQECKQAGIETMTPMELDRLKETWYEPKNQSPANQPGSETASV